MKRNYAYLKAAILSFTLLFGLEYLLIVLSGDYQNCFWHNSIMGNVLAWSIRSVLFCLLTSVLSAFFLPAYKTLRDRMIEKENKKPAQSILSEPLTLDGYFLKQAK